MGTRTIATDLKLTGEKEFNTAMAAVNSNMKALRSEMNVVTSEFGKNDASMSQNMRMLKNLSAQNDQQKEVIRAATIALKQNEEAYGKDSKEADKFRTIIANAQTIINKNTQQMEVYSGAIKKQVAATNQAEKTISKYIPVTQRMASAVNSAKGKVSDFTGRVKEGSHHVPVLAEALDILSASAPVAGAALKVTGKTIGMVGSTAISAGKGIGSAAISAGKGVAKLSALSVAAAGVVATAGVAGLKLMADYAKEAAEAAKAAQEAGEPLTDAQKQWLAFSDQLGELDKATASAKAALGGVLLPVLGDLSEVGAQFLRDFAADMEATAGDTEAQGKVMAQYVAKGAQLIKDKLPEYLETGKALLKGLGEGLAEEGPELLETGIDLLMDLLDQIIEFAPQIGEGGMQLIEKLVESLIERGPDMVTSAANLVTQLVQGLAQSAPTLIPQALNLVTTLVTALIQAAPDLLIAGLELILGIISGLTQGLGNIASSAGEILETIKSAFGEKMSQIVGIGSQIVQGIWTGISNGYDWIAGKISGWVDSVVKWIKEKLGIKSPSRVMRDQVGKFMAEGIGVGFEQEMRNVNRQIQAAINTDFRVPNLGTKTSGYSGRSYNVGSGSRVVNLYITAKQLTEEDIRMIVRTVNEELGEAI